MNLNEVSTEELEAELDRRKSKVYDEVADLYEKWKTIKASFRNVDEGYWHLEPADRVFRNLLETRTNPDLWMASDWC